jgi:2-alkyl-3-oxoalkanoate reductase
MSQRALVTGCGGFLGLELVRQLRARGDEVIGLARGRYPEVEALGAQTAQVDLTDPRVAAVLPGLLEGVDVVYHTAARAGFWGPREDFVAINVDATARLLAAARQAGVKRFVYTSSPSATFGGGDHCGATEKDAPYPASFLAVYPETKALAEQRVLEAHGRADPGLRPMQTTALRPHLIYGPRDPHLIPRLLERARRGRLVRVGDGQNRVGLTYVVNAAAAHIQANDALEAGRGCGGRAFFITDPDPVVLWEWISTLLVEVGAPPIRRSVSLRSATLVGGVMELLWRVLPLPGEPPMTRFVAAQLATSHWYDLSGARELAGYDPPVSGSDGFARLVASLRGTQHA